MDTAVDRAGRRAAEAISIALVNDYEVVVHGLRRMFDSYRDRIRVVELDVDLDVGTPVDVALYDTFGQTQGDCDDVLTLVSNPLVGRVAVYSWNVEQRLVDSTIEQGVSGYLSKSLGAADLVTAIERIHRGETVVPPEVQGSLDTDLGDWPGREEGLTQREAEVVALITQGLSNDEIALRTYLSINSVKSFIRSAYRRMGVQTRTQAVIWGVDHGLLPDRASRVR